MFRNWQLSHLKQAMTSLFQNDTFLTVTDPPTSVMWASLRHDQHFVLAIERAYPPVPSVQSNPPSQVDNREFWLLFISTVTRSREVIDD